MRIKPGFYLIIACLILSAVLSVPPTHGHAEDALCFHCGMARSKFGHSWVVIDTDDGRRTGVCSLHCLAIELVMNKDNLIKTITVGDFNTNKQIDAYKAYWVIGGDIKGVMTENAKWAFEKKADAQAFVKGHGGRLAVFEEVIRTAFGDLYEDTVAMKRKKLMYEMQQAGQKE